MGHVGGSGAGEFAAPPMGSGWELTPTGCSVGDTLVQFSPRATPPSLHNSRDIWPKSLCLK